MLNLFIGLVATMLANVLLGMTLAKLKQNFNKKKFLEGLVKIVSILGGVGLMYLTSYLNPDILVANINGTNVNLIDAIKLLFLAGIIMYGSQDLIKLKDILKLKTEVLELQEESTIKIPTDNIIERGD
ncbi:unknown [Mycoplasma sp. CAG:877]|nr:unknown [Mycoplasma sp. CAG:877]